jgi:threonine aldolase
VNRRIDLRSDTVTRPCPAMRRAMYEAEVGDDVYGEDPNVNALEAETAALLGHEAGLFLASGTQSNLVALLTHCGRGDEYIVGGRAHTFWYEGGGAAALGGIQPQTLPFEADGTLDLDAAAALVKPDDPHFARSRLLCLENTQAGRPIGPDYFVAARALCDRMGLRLHLDGARLFNAAVALGSQAADIARQCDSVSLCLSKGLGAPVGSVLVGSRAFIAAARRWRKMVGGGMRQAGILAAAGRHALRHNVARLAEDHANAARVAGLVCECHPGGARHHTNMVFVDLPPVELAALTERLARAGIITRGNRWVLHKDVSAADVEAVGVALRTV